MRIRQSIVAPRIRQPYVWIAAGIETDTTANLQRITGTPGKTKARHDEVQPIDIGVIPNSGGRRDGRVEVRSVVTRKLLVAETSNNCQVIIVKIDFVLKVVTVQDVAETRSRIFSIIRAAAAAIVDPARAAKLKSVDAGHPTKRVVQTSLGIKQQARCRVANRIIEIVVFSAAGMLYELVEDAEVLSFITEGKDMVTGEVFTDEFEVVGFPVERIRLAGIISAEINGAIAAADADLHISEVFRTNGNLRIRHLRRVVVNLGRECVRPLRIQFDGCCLHLRTLHIVVIGELEFVRVAV